MKSQRPVWNYLGYAGVISLVSLAVGWCALLLLIRRLPFLAIAAMVVAFFLDCLDGYVARKQGTASDFGRQLDGMCDFFNYSVCSALLFWLYVVPDTAGATVGFVILAGGMVRLVRFNIEGYLVKGDERYYAGIVTCHVALTAILLALVRHWQPQITAIVALPLMLAVSCLQVSRIPVRKNSLRLWLPVAGVLFLSAIGLHLWNR